MATFELASCFVGWFVILIVFFLVILIVLFLLSIFIGPSPHRMAGKSVDEDDALEGQFNGLVDRGKGYLERTRRLGCQPHTAP